MPLSSSTPSASALSRMIPRAHHEIIRHSWTRTLAIRGNSQHRLARLAAIRCARSAEHVRVTRVSLFEPTADLINHNVRYRTDRAAADGLSFVRTWPRSHIGNSHEHHLDSRTPGIADSRRPHPDHTPATELHRGGISDHFRIAGIVPRYSPLTGRSGAATPRWLRHWRQAVSADNGPAFWSPLSLFHLIPRRMSSPGNGTCQSRSEIASPTVRHSTDVIPYCDESSTMNSGSFMKEPQLVMATFLVAAP